MCSKKNSLPGGCAEKKNARETSLHASSSSTPIITAIAGEVFTPQFLGVLLGEIVPFHLLDHNKRRRERQGDATLLNGTRATTTNMPSAVDLTASMIVTSPSTSGRRFFFEIR